MYLIDTDVISESRKGKACNAGVVAFFDKVREQGSDVYLSVVTLGELRTGVERIRLRGDAAQARLLEGWLDRLRSEYADAIIGFDQEASEVWGHLRAAHPENALDKQIAATALIHGLTVVSRNSRDFVATGAKVLNPFT